MIKNLVPVIKSNRLHGKATLCESLEATAFMKDTKNMLNGGEITA
jgi:hypothetical protein